MANLNPNGISGLPQPPCAAPSMGIMAMMASAAVPPPVPTLGVLPAATTSATSSTSNSEVQQPQMTSNLVLGNNNRRKSSSPNVALINVTNPGSHIIEFFSYFTIVVCFLYLGNRLY